MTPVVTLLDEFISVTVKPVSPIRSGKGSAETRKYLAQDNEGVKAFLAELVWRAEEQGGGRMEEA